MLERIVRLSIRQRYIVLVLVAPWVAPWLG